VKRRTLLLGLSAGSAALVAGVSLPVLRAAVGEAPDQLGSDPSFGEGSIYALGSRWTTDAGRVLMLPELAGRVQLLAMMFTSCPSVCPTFVREIVALDRSIPEPLRKRTHVVLVSIDPERDTPEVLSRYRGRMGLERERYALLRGEAGDVRELAQVIGVAYSKTEGAEIAHTRLLTVLDRSGAVVHQQAGIREDEERLIQGIARADVGRAG
jgi:protein SCO1/2